MLSAVSGLDLITSALRLAGVLGEAETPSGPMGADALTRLNRMVDRWSTQRLTIYVTTRTAFTLTGSDQSYTIGSGADFNIERPLWIPYAGVIPTGTNQPEIPIACLTDKDWANKAIKGSGVISGQSFTSTFPTELYYDYSFASATGYGTIIVWPMPTTACTLVLYTPTAVGIFADLSTTYLFPPGYQDALEYNLAVRLSQAYPGAGELRADVIRDAAMFLADIKRANRRLIDLSIDRGVLPQQAGGWNYLTGSNNVR